MQDPHQDAARLRESAHRLCDGAARLDRVALGLVAGSVGCPVVQRADEESEPVVQVACTTANLVGLGSLVAAWGKQYRADERESHAAIAEHVPIGTGNGGRVPDRTR